MNPKRDQPKPKKQSGNQSDPPDGRGPRPTDPNELAKWIVDQTIGEDQAATKTPAE